ncbi:uncharacterized protein BO87DRAFT_437626 [Aspergillus neoniger CBS 115656]|uniref:Uncharacterized protein n=1 Tax=Aspergillus neoniger (strain CBS 115656) TaxID=1448310 RepID=A0A318Z0E0_ASPNB|nr:hypothetical protein BO87DRAFT_437626 [Aspergillus neoniger CBS 115656]PYH33578.1 hypothetical protein BO87DRAFT_437626 [Aspergillus neoniger CBS 115656]
MRMQKKVTDLPCAVGYAQPYTVPGTLHGRYLSSQRSATRLIYGAAVNRGYYAQRTKYSPQQLRHFLIHSADNIHLLSSWKEKEKGKKWNIPEAGSGGQQQQQQQLTTTLIPVLEEGLSPSPLSCTYARELLLLLLLLLCPLTPSLASTRSRV